MGRDVEGSGGAPVRGAIRGLVWKVRVARRLDGESNMELLDYEVAVMPT
jgi:hypothetical protein